MWIRKQNGDVQSLDTGHALAVKTVENAQREKSFNLISYNPTVGSVVLTEGYATEEDARAALEEFVSALDITPADVPVVPSDNDDTEGK